MPSYFEISCGGAVEAYVQCRTLDYISLACFLAPPRRLHWLLQAFYEEDSQNSQTSSTISVKRLPASKSSTELGLCVMITDHDFTCLAIA